MVMSLQAFASLDAQTLVALCRSDVPASVESCKTYIAGFLDGAQATDPSVAKRVIDEAEEMSPWMRRAIATRVGNRMERSGDSYYANFCVVDEDPARLVYDRLRNQDVRPDGQSAGRFLYGFLQDHFPCS
jgi:hypothetical protein